MKKIISVLITAVMMLCVFSAAPVLTEITAQNTETYTAEDLVILRDFLLGRRTTGSGKDFDLNHDGVWDIFDLCILRREVMKNITENNDEPDILVVYFSCTNNTEGIAKYVVDYLNADSYEIIPQIPYTSDDLNYNTDCRANREQNDSTARPEISGNIENMDDYEIIFVGYPIWWGQAPKIMYTFVESYDLSDKIIVPFCTSGSSGIGTSAVNLSKSSPESTWLDGRRFSGNASESSVTEWIESLNLNELIEK